jgi:phosphoesterase RecJ-like protein
VALLTLKKEWTGGRDVDTELFVNYARNLITTELAVMIIETDTGVRINLRSKGNFDARAVAAELGGGGHKAAAGIRMKATIDEAKAALLKVISEKI